MLSFKMETTAEEVSSPLSSRVKVVRSETLPSAGLKPSLFSRRVDWGEDELRSLFNSFGAAKALLVATQVNYRTIMSEKE